MADRNQDINGYVMDDLYNGYNKKKKENNKNKEDGFNLSLETKFKLFTIGAFLMGTPVMVGLFAAAIGAVLLKKGYDFFKANGKDILNSLKSAFNSVKDNSIDKLPDKFSEYIDLGKNKDKEAASKEEFLDNIAKASSTYFKSKEGIEAMNNPAFKTMFKNCLGVSFEEVKAKIEKNFEKEVSKADELNKETPFVENETPIKETKESTLEEFLNDDEFTPTGDEKEENKEATLEDEYKEGERETQIDEDAPSIDDSSKNLTNDDKELDDNNFRLLDISDDEFDKEVASPEDLQNELTQDLVKNKEPVM